MPSVTQKKRIDCFCADRNVGITQNEIWDLREAVLRDRVGGIQLHVAVDALDLFAYMIHKAIISPAQRPRRGLSPAVTSVVLRHR